jgi:ribose-phosphate pyrophosphokinase
VVVWRGLHQPNEKLVELLLVARAAREPGAQHLTLVAPYLAYMRQDIAFSRARRSASASSAAFWPTCSMP